MLLSLGTSDGATSTVGDDALLVWLDETGNEDHSDPNYPIFGLGGCVVAARKYRSEVYEPWQKIKKDVFGGAVSLHASDLRNPTEAQIAALSKFFDYRAFGRAAAIVPISANVAPTLEIYQACAVALWLRIAAVASTVHYSGVAMIVEASERGDASAEKWLSQISATRSYDGGEFEELPMQHFFMPKHLSEPGLEVADFIVHTAGREGRARNRGAEPVKDFKHIFSPVRRRLASYLYVQSVRDNQA